MIRTRKMTQADFERMLGYPPGALDIDRVIKGPPPDNAFTRMLRGLSPDGAFVPIVYSNPAGKPPE